ncbi:hypothetical protein J4474_04005 [Candidatus Pacearchaeota archaeon]|nr:hypothetical protein [Candidatus Pacearchaeota archaeon]
MVNKIWTFGLISLLVLLFVSLMVSALPSNIDIKTLPYHKVIVTVSKDSSVLERFNGTSNYFGELNFSHSSTLKDFDVFVQVDTLGGERVYGPELYPEHRSGDPLLVELFPVGYVFPSAPSIKSENNSSVENSSISDSNETLVNSSITGAVISKDASSNKSGILTNLAILDEQGKLNFSTSFFVYLIVLIVIILAIFFLVKRLRNRDPYSKGNKNEEVKVRKLSEVLAEKESGESSSGSSQDLLAAQQKLREAESEVNKLRNKDKIEALKREIDNLERGN